MKKIIFIAHDPGGYDVVFPVFKMFESQKSLPAELFCIGPAGKLNNVYSITDEEAWERLNSNIASGTIATLVTGTSWGSDFELRAISLVRESAVPTFSILDYWVSYKSRLVDKMGNLVYPDFYILMDELAGKGAVQEGVPEEIIHVLGQPGIDSWIEYGKTGITKDNPYGQKKILFLCQPLSKLYGDKLGYTEEIVLGDCVCAIERFPELSFAIKFHPKDDEELRKKYKEIAVEGDLKAILPDFDLVIGMSTMGLLFSALMGIKTVSYQPGMVGDDMCITNQLGITTLLKTYEDLSEYIEQFYQNRSPENGKRELEKFLWSDGRSTERVYDFIRKILTI